MRKTLSLVVFPFTTLCIAAAQAAPQVPQKAPQLGEIALEGTVEKIDLAGHKIELRATAFSTPSGGKKQLPAAKVKVIEVNNSTQFFETGKRYSLIFDDMEKGNVITVVGRDGSATKPFIARLVSWMPVEQIKADPLTPAAIAALLPAPQTKGNFTLRTIDGGFKPGNKILPYATKNARPVFFVTSTLADAGEISKGWAGSKAENALRLVRISGPNNQMLEGIGGGPLHRGNGFYSGRIDGYSNVRPEWKSLTAEWELVDPAMPAKDLGQSESTLTFKDIPAPHEWDKQIPVNQEMLTPQGARVIIDKVFTQQLPPTLPYKGTTFFSIRIVPPADKPGVITNVELGNNTVSNEDGTYWNVSSWGSGGGNVYIHSIPAENAKTINVAFKVKETAPATIDSKWLYRFKQEIPVASLLKAIPLEKQPVSVPPLAVAKGQNADLQIERNLDWNDGWSGLLWLQSHDLKALPTQRWLLRSAKATGDGDKKFDVWTYSNDYDHITWHESGNPAASNEHSNPIVVPFKGAKPEKIDIDFNLESAQRMEKWDWLRNIPVPAYGKSLELPDGQLENDEMKVRRIFWFKNGEDMTGWSEGRRHNQNDGGLAIVVETTPIFTGSELNFSKTVLFDERDRASETTPYFTNGDAGRAGTENTNLKTIILSKFYGPKTINLWINSVETKWTGNTEKITLHDIPVK